MSATHRSTPDGAPPTGRAAFVAATATALAALHLFLVNYYVPLRGIFRKVPLQGVDYDLHIGQVYRVVEALEGWGKSWLYDVQLLAGQPEGTILDSGSKGWELWTFALHRLGVDRAIAFNTFVLLVMLAPPLLLYAAARAFDLGRWASLLAAAMVSSLWFFDSHIHWIWFIGMASWGLASCLAPLTIALFHRLLTTERNRLIVPCALCLGGGLLIHPYTFFAAGPSMIVSYAHAFRNLSRRGHAAVIAIAATALAMNGYWLANAARDWHYVLDSAFYAQGGPRFLLCDLLDVLCSGTDTGVIGTRTGFRFLYLALAVLGLVTLRRGRDGRFLPLAVGVGALYFFAYIGGVLPGLQQTQPYRQITPAAILCVVPAAIFVEWLVRERLLAGLSFGATALLAVLGGCLVQRLVANDVLYFVPRAIPEPGRLLDGSRSPMSKYGFLWPFETPSHVHFGVPKADFVEEAMNDEIAWLRHHVPPGARLLVEGAGLGERIAWQGEYEVIGGFTERNIAYAYSNYFRMYAGQTPDESDVARYLHVFAVEWILSNRPEFERYHDAVELVASVGWTKIYRTREKVKRVLASSGKAHASSNRIEVVGSSPTEPVILSYHFHDALRCKPDCRVEREEVDIDRVGLIRIPTPHPADVVIYNSYFR